MYFCKSLEHNVFCVVSCWCWCNVIVSITITQCSLCCVKKSCVKIYFWIFHLALRPGTAQMIIIFIKVQFNWITGESASWNRTSLNKKYVLYAHEHCWHFESSVCPRNWWNFPLAQLRQPFAVATPASGLNFSCLHRVHDAIPALVCLSLYVPGGHATQ